jgi:hypothetical protein
MNDTLLAKQKDAQGRTRFYVLPIESEAGFQDLIKFVSQDFGCEFGELDRGPGTMIQKGIVGGKALIFVLSDSTGTQFFAEDENDVGIAERIAKGVEARLREVMNT